MSEACGTYGGGDKRNTYRVFVGKPEEKSFFVKPRRRWENNIKVDLNTLRTRSFKLFKRPFPGFLTILTL